MTYYMLDDGSVKIIAESQYDWEILDQFVSHLLDKRPLKRDNYGETILKVQKEADYAKR